MRQSILAANIFIRSWANIQFDLWWTIVGAGRNARTTVANPATLDVKSMVGRNYSEGAEEKFLKLAKYAAAHIASWLTMEQVGGCPMAMA